MPKNSKWKSLLDFLAKPLFFGWQSRLPNADNRLTAVINFCSILGIISLIFVALNVYSFGSPLAFWYLVPISLGFLCLWLNAKNRLTQARLVLILKINLIALFAGLFFGKGFNGYLTYFLGLSFSVSFFGKTKKSYMIFCLLISFLGLPLMDILTAYGITPLLAIPPGLIAHPLPALLIDTFTISGIFVLALAVDRWNSESYERSLETWKEALEREVKERTSELLRAKEVAEHASLLKSQFLANISHELRTPMQGMMGFTFLAKSQLDIQESADEEKLSLVRKYLDEIDQSSARLQNFLARLFEITSYSSSDVNSHPSQGNLRQLVSRVLAELNLVKEQKNLTWRVRVEGSTEVRVDFTLLEKALESVLENACKFANPKSEVLVQIATDPMGCTIDVTNEGVGILPNEVESIFEPFTQSSLTDKTIGGTGLGLYRARRYLRAMGGTLSLISPNPKATTFRLSFPNRRAMDTIVGEGPNI